MHLNHPETTPPLTLVCGKTCLLPDQALVPTMLGTTALEHSTRISNKEFDLPAAHRGSLPWVIMIRVFGSGWSKWHQEPPQTPCQAGRHPGREGVVAPSQEGCTYLLAPPSCGLSPLSLAAKCCKNPEAAGVKALSPWWLSSQMRKLKFRKVKGPLEFQLRWAGSVFKHWTWWLRFIWPKLSRHREQAQNDYGFKTVKLL